MYPLLLIVVMFILFCDLLVFFKQKTSYAMRISDWISDVCSSDLLRVGVRIAQLAQRAHACLHVVGADRVVRQDRKSGGEGKSVSVRVDLGGPRIIKPKQSKQTQEKASALKQQKRCTNREDKA